MSEVMMLHALAISFAGITGIVGAWRGDYDLPIWCGAGAIIVVAIGTFGT